MEQIAEQNQKKRLGKRRITAKKVILPILVIALLGAAGFGVYRLFFKQEERVAVTGSTTYGYLNEAIEGSGTTTPADSISYDVSGTVLEWYVEAGQDVEAGDLLYVLDTSDVQDEILDNEVELDDLYQQLADLRENINNQRVTADFAGRVENVAAEVGQRVQSGATLARLIDDSAMKATLYFSYIYQDAVYRGMAVTASFPEQMLTLAGKVGDIQYVDYTTPEGLKCFAVEVEIENPGSLTEGTTVTCWMEDANGEPIYAVNDAALEYRQVESVTAGATGELSAVNVVDYQRVGAGQTLFVIDASSYETQMETLQKQIKNLEEKIADLRESVATEYTRCADISGRVVTATYSKNRMTGKDMGSVVIYNQDSMEISVNIDELDADYLTVGMDVTVYRTTSSRTVTYPATLSYLSLEATSGQSGVSTFAATITIDSKGELSSGVTVYYSIDISGGEGGAVETVLAPLNALCSYDDGYYLIVRSDSEPANAIDPASVGGSVTDYPKGYYAVPVEAGSFNESYIQILSGVERDAVLFLRYRSAAPAGGDTTSLVSNDEGESGGMPSFGGGMPDFGGGMPDFSGGMPSYSTTGTLKYYGSSNTTAKIYFGNEQWSACNNFTLNEGRDLTKLDVEGKNLTCVIGSYVADSLFGYRNAVGETLMYDGHPLTVAGVFYAKDGSAEESMDDMIVIPYTLNRQILNTDSVTQFAIKVSASPYMDTVIKSVEDWMGENFNTNRGSYSVENGNDAMNAAEDETASLQVVLGGVAGIALLVGGIGIMNIMLVTVTERTREIGIKKAIGAQRDVIVSQFLVESTVLSGIGGVIGILLGYAGSLLAGKLIYDLVLFPEPWMTLAAFLFSLLIGVGFGMYPAVKASGLQPVDALRAD